MPIEYRQLPGLDLGNMNLMGAFAQGQAMSLNNLRAQALQNELAQQQGLRNAMARPGFGFNSPTAVQDLINAGAFDEALKLKQAQDISAVHGAQKENYLNEILIRGKTFDANLPNIKAMTKEHLANANSAELKLFSDRTSTAQDLISRLDPEGADWAEKRKEIMTLDPTLRPPEEFNPGWNQRALRTAKVMQDVATDLAKKRGEAAIPKVMAPTADMPGMLVTPRGVSKLPELTAEEQPNLGQTAWGEEPTAPVVKPEAPMKGRMASIELPPDVMALQKKMAEEEQVKRLAPIGREREALGSFRFSRTLKGIGDTFVDLAKAKGITVPGETPQETFEALGNRTRAGEILGKMDASERLALVDSLRSQVMTAIPQFAAAAGLQSKNFDSDAEGKRLQAALANPDNIANISSAFQILNNLNKQFGTGAPLFEGRKEVQGILGARRAAQPSPTSTLAPDVASKVNDIWGIK